MAISLVVVPVSFVVVSGLVGHLAVTTLHALGPVALVNAPIFVTELTVTVAHTVEPRTFILNALFRVHVSAVTVAKAVQHFSLVGRLVRPLVGALSCDLVLLEFTAVDGVVRPFERAFAVEQTISQLALVLVAVLENTSAVSMEHFTDLNTSEPKQKLTCPFLVWSMTSPFQLEMTSCVNCAGKNVTFGSGSISI